jgi:hypothetical protein
MTLTRCGVLQRGFSLGALTLLTGCDISDNDAVQSWLAKVSRWNDRVQEAIFNPNKLAATFSETQAVKKFRYNAWYGATLAPNLDAVDYRLLLPGKIANKGPGL